MRNGKAIMPMHKCDTISQYYVYKWIKQNFILDFISLKNYKRNTIQLTDFNQNIAYISYSDGFITIKYNNDPNSKSEIFPFKKP